MDTDLDTGTGPPSNGGTCAPRKAAAMQSPTAVPAKGGAATVAEVTLPPGANVTATLAIPVGPPSLLQA